MKRYQCSACKFIYNPSKGDPENDVMAGTIFDDLPLDWVCPECGSSIECFESMDDFATIETDEGSSE